ncbi:hypothetical protein ACWGF2_31430 [Streptomyces sp. NPDC054919]
MVRDLAGVTPLIGDVTDQGMCPRSTAAVLRMLGRVRTAVRAAHAEHTGTAPAQDDILDLRALGQRSRSPAGIRTPKTVDLRTIGQRWLRNLLRTSPGRASTGRSMPVCDHAKPRSASGRCGSRALPRRAAAMLVTFVRFTPGEVLTLSRHPDAPQKRTQATAPSVLEEKRFNGYLRIKLPHELDEIVESVMDAFGLFSRSDSGRVSEQRRRPTGLSKTAPTP